MELLGSTKRRRLRWCSKLSSSKQQQQHSVQVRIGQKLSWHETFAETPNKCQLRDSTRTASEADGSVLQRDDADTHHRDGLTFILTVLTGVSRKNVSRA